MRLRYREDPGITDCPGESRLREEVQLRMGYDPFQPQAGGEVSVEIFRRGAGLSAEVEYRDETGALTDTRTFEAPETACGCWTLVTYVAVSIAFVMTPFDLPAKQSSCPEGPPCPPPPPCPPERPPEPTRRAELGVGGAGHLGLMSGVAGGVFWFGRIRWEFVSLALEGRVIFPSREVGSRGTPLDVAMLSGLLVPCVHVRFALLCGVGEIGTLQMQSDAVEPEDRGGLLLSVGLRLGAELPLGERFGLHAHAELLTMSTPTQMRVDAHEIWSTSAVTGLFGGGVLVSF